MQTLFNNADSFLLCSSRHIQFPKTRAAFTLIELLTVISIIAILSSLLLPALGSANEKGRITKCISNFRQIGIAVEMYKHETDNGVYPPASVQDSDGAVKRTDNTLGGQAPAPTFRLVYPSAERRPLYPYLGTSEVFRCPRDRGQRILPCRGDPSLVQKPTNWETAGSSYDYNTGNHPVPLGGGLRHTRDGVLPGQPSNWVPFPSKYIVMHEPPARAYTCGGTGEWYQWHYSARVSDISDSRLAPARFISPTLYADGHCQVNDFSASIQQNWFFPYEETKEWMWYKPLPDK